MTLKIGIKEDMESGTFYCLSLTSEKDGTFRSARIPFSPESHSFENGSKLRRTVQEGDDLCINVNGTGTSMISVQNGIFTTIPLYYLNIKNQMTVQIFIKLTENGEKVKATFNNETFEIQVDAEKKVQIELLLLTGSFRTVLAIEGKDVYRQTFEVVSEENSNVCFTNETCSTDISDVVESHSADSTRANDPQGDKMCNKIYSKKDENDLSQFNVDKGIIEMIKNVERNKDVDYNGICDELGSNDETEVLERDEEINLSFDSSDSNANAFSADDKNDSLLKEPSSFSHDPYHELRNIKQKALSNETVDIRRNRTVLLKTMRSDKLADYFFERSLISEDNLNEISEYVRKDNIWFANSCFLRILRNRRVTKQEIEAVLSIAEEPHLLGLLFPIQSQFESAFTNETY